MLPEWFKNLPDDIRSNFWRELIAIIPFSVVTGVLAHNYCGFVARKALHMPDYLLAWLMSCHMLGLLLAGPVISYIHHLNKIRILSLFYTIISTLLLTVALTPTHKLSNETVSYLYLIQIFLIQVGAAQVSTLRSSVWRNNYPIEHRGKLVVALTLTMTLFNTLTIFIFSRAMDIWNISYQIPFGLSAIFGFIAAILILRVQEQKISGTIIKISNWSSGFFQSFSILKTDKRFRIFMSWQMMHGLATMMVEVVIIIIIADEFNLNWTEGGAALAAIPLFVTGISSILWARYFDKHTIFKIRTISAGIWALARFTLVAAIILNSLEIVLVSRIISGIAMGGGQLAWRLGHMEFAPKNQDALYMGAHVSLTGLRGVIAPFIGIMAYHVIGSLWLFILTGTLQFIAAIGFWYMPKLFQKLDTSKPPLQPLDH